MNDCKPTSTPYAVRLKLEKATSRDDRPYQELMDYLATCSRPDIAHTISFLSKFNGEQHWTAAKRVLRYLKQTVSHCLTYEKLSLEIITYVDADYANDVVDRRSYTEYVFLLGDGGIAWESKKQSTVSLSTSEAEYCAMSEATEEAKFLNNLIYEILDKQITIKMFNDNQSAQFWSKEQMPYSRTKHIDVRK